MKTTSIMGRALAWGMILLAAGCAQERVVMLSTKPPEAKLTVDGKNVGRPPVKYKFTFFGPSTVHRITASLPGYRDQTVQITQDFTQENLLIELRPMTRRVTFNVGPVPAIIRANGKPLVAEPVTQLTTELEFTLDAKSNWTSHVVTADRTGFQQARALVKWTDRESTYAIQLEPLRKDLAVTTTPPGASIWLDGEPLGQTPLLVASIAFPINTETDQFVPRVLKCERTGYETVEQPIAWDNGQTDYHVELPMKSKEVRIVSNPGGATVTIDGKDLPRDPAGASAIKLVFPPVDDSGQELKSYTAAVMKKPSSDGSGEWEPAQLTIGWDEGRSEYRVTLKEITTRKVPLLSVVPQRATDGGWEFAARRSTTIGMKDTGEGPGREPPLQVTRLPAGTQIDTLALAPDSSAIVLSILSDKDGAIRSQMLRVAPDGSGGTEMLSDGKSLELYPSFTPDGKHVIFSSNRAGRRMNIWQTSATGAPGITQLTAGDTNDLWPVVDSDPRPRLFYQALVDTRPDARLYMTQLGSTTRTDLTPLGGLQPRVNPGADSILFALVNEKTGKRDLYRVPDRGGVPENLTNTPDADEFDAVWSPDGARIAFACDRATDQDKRHTYDIWILDLNQPERPIQLTTNASQDDCPAWDPAGGHIYFRSNRGGQWGVWKIGIAAE